MAVASTAKKLTTNTKEKAKPGLKLVKETKTTSTPDLTKLTKNEAIDTLIEVFNSSIKDCKSKKAQKNESFSIDSVIKVFEAYKSIAKSMKGK